MRTDVLGVGMAMVCLAVLVHPAKSGAGGSPSGCAPVMIGGQPVPQYPSNQYSTQPVPREGLLKRRQPTATASQTPTAARIRGQNSDDAVPELSKVNDRPALQMPSPEQLGLAATGRAAEVDW